MLPQIIYVSTYEALKIKRWPMFCVGGWRQKVPWRKTQIQMNGSDGTKWYGKEWKATFVYTAHSIFSRCGGLRVGFFGHQQDKCWEEKKASVCRSTEKTVSILPSAQAALICIPSAITYNGIDYCSRDSVRPYADLPKMRSTSSSW